MNIGTQSNGVMIGRDGHLFLVGGAHDVLAFVTGERKVPEKSFSAFGDMVAARAARCAKAGIPFRHLLFPDKQSALSALFPVEAPVCLGDEYLARCPNARAHVVYPKATLAAAGADTYQRSDTHASDLGNVLVVAESVAALTGEAQDANVAALLAKRTEVREVPGDLGSKLAPPMPSRELFVQVDWKLHRFVNHLTGGNNGVTDLYVSPNAVYPKRLLVFGDSFARGMAPLLSFFFREVAFLRTPFFHAEIFNQMKPDFVLTQAVERYLSRVQTDEAAPAFCMYPYLTDKVAAYTPPMKFAAAFSAMLSYPRSPYRDFMRGLLAE